MFSYLELLWIWFFGSKITILSSTEILRSEIEERISSFLDLTLPVSCMPIFLLLFATISLKMIYSKYFLSSSIFSLKSVWSFFSLHFSSVTQLCLTLCDPMNHSTPGLPVDHQLLEWVAFPFSRVSSQPRDWTQVSLIAGRFFTSWATREAQEYWSG